MTPLSRARLATCHADLIRLFDAVDEEWPCYILDGHRSDLMQAEYYKKGKSKLKPGESRHNKLPSEAVDAGPKPDPYNVKRCRQFADLVLKKAAELDIRIRWGGDWDGDGDTKDQKFNDLVHFELA